MMRERLSHCYVGQCGCHAAVQNSAEVQQFGPERAFHRDAVGMAPDHSNSHKTVEVGFEQEIILAGRVRFSSKSHPAHPAVRGLIAEDAIGRSNASPRTLEKTSPAPRHRACRGTPARAA